MCASSGADVTFEAWLVRAVSVTGHVTRVCLMGAFSASIHSFDAKTYNPLQNCIRGALWLGTVRNCEA